MKCKPKVIECYLLDDVNNILETDEYYIDRTLSKVRNCYVLIKRVRPIKK